MIFLLNAMLSNSEKHLLPFSSIMMLQKGGVLNLRFLSFDRLIILLHLIKIRENDKKDFVDVLIIL